MKRWLKQHGTKLVVAFWAAASLVVMATLMVGHWYTLPRPATSNETLHAAMAELRPEGFDGFLVVHFLYVDCRCSQRIFDHLLEHERPRDVREAVVLVDDDPEFREAATKRGFDVIVVTAEELATRFGVTGAPLFAVANERDTVRYLGGYTDRKQGLDVRDVAIVTDLQNQRATAELPLFGCATSVELQELLDPLGLKY